MEWIEKYNGQIEQRERVQTKSQERQIERKKKEGETNTNNGKKTETERERGEGPDELKKCCLERGAHSVSEQRNVERAFSSVGVDVHVK